MDASRSESITGAASQPVPPSRSPKLLKIVQMISMYLLISAINGRFVGVPLVAAWYHRRFSSSSASIQAESKAVHRNVFAAGLEFEYKVFLSTSRQPRLDDDNFVNSLVWHETGLFYDFRVRRRE